MEKIPFILTHMPQPEMALGHMEKIPFILTHMPQPEMALVLDDGDGAAMLGNVASVTALRPRRLCYLYVWRQDSAARDLKGKLKTLTAYLERSHIRCVVDLRVAVSGEWMQRAQKALLDSPVKTRFLRCGEDAAGKALLEGLEPETLFDGGTPLFEDPQKQARFVAAVRERMGYFLFDRETRQFTVCEGCEQLRYLQSRARLRVEDLEALCGIRWATGELPEYEEEYEALWQVCAQVGGDCWGALCRQLAEDAARRDLLGQAPRGDTARTIRFYFPGGGTPGAEKLLRQLRALGVVDRSCSLQGCASDTCQIEMTTCWELEPVLEKLFSRWYLLTDPERLEVTMEPDEVISVRCDGLTVEGLTGFDDAMWAALEALYRAGLILMLRKDGEKVSFVYTSQRLKRILTQPDGLLGVRCYYEALDQGRFSDISCDRGSLLLMDGFRPLPVCCVSGTPGLDRYLRFAEETVALGAVCRTLVCQRLPEEAVLQQAQAMGIVTVCV